MVDLCDHSLHRRALVQGQKIVHWYWWTDELTILRRTSFRARRRYQRAGRRDNIETTDREQAPYFSTTKETKRAIRVAQSESWKKCCLVVDGDLWRLPSYRVVMRKLGIRTSFTASQELAIVIALFSSRSDMDQGHHSTFGTSSWAFQTLETGFHSFQVAMRKAPDAGYVLK